MFHVSASSPRSCCLLRCHDKSNCSTCLPKGKLVVCRIRPDVGRTVSKGSVGISTPRCVCPMYTSSGCSVPSGAPTSCNSVGSSNYPFPNSSLGAYFKIRAVPSTFT